MVLEKWTAVADICRCLHNFNGVLQVRSCISIKSLKEFSEKTGSGALG
jgi:hypothetical protein